MSREFYPGTFMHIADLQPHLAPFQYDIPQTSSAPAAPYEMTAEGAGAAEAAAGAGASAGLASSVLPPAHHDHAKRRDSHFSDGFEGAGVPACEGFEAVGMPPCEGYEREAAPSCDGYEGAGMPACDARSVAGSSTGSVATPSSRKRKAGSSFSATSAFEEDDDARSVRTMPDRRQNHSEIEKRRRDKMNTYITELSSLVPMCGAMARKLDKLTVLRLAVQHLRAVRGRAAAPLAARPRPALLADRDLNALVLAAAGDSFLLVLGCDRGRLLYVSASVTDTLHYHQSELVGQSLFDILHPKDVGKVKEQLSSSDLNPRERLIDAKTMLPVKSVGAAASRLGPGGRRSFYCRIKCKSPAAPPHSLQHSLQHSHHSPPLKEEHDPPAKIRKKHNVDKKYCVVQCTGFLKSWAAGELCAGEGAGGGACEEEEGSMACLVAVGRALAARPAPAPPPAPPTRRLQFHSRHAIDGKYVFVDQRVTLALGFLPQELLGTSLYEVVSARALGAVARAHKAALAPAPLRARAALTPPYAARRKDGSHALLTTHFKPFRNPWTKEVECLMARNTLVAEAPRNAYDPMYRGSGGCYESVSESGGSGSRSGSGSDGDAEVQRLIDSQVEAHKIGSAIAEEALRRSPAAAAGTVGTALFSPETSQEALLQEAFFNQVLVDNMLPPEMSCQVRADVPLSAARARSPPLAEDSPLALDGNNEAAMAVIMSLLEADAGLGGPVNFSGLPWPLP